MKHNFEEGKRVLGEMCRIVSSGGSSAMRTVLRQTTAREHPAMFIAELMLYYDGRVPTGRGNFGASLRSLMRGSKREDGVRRQVMRILSSVDRQSLYEEIRLIAPRMFRMGIGIDYWKLYEDVYNWNDETRREWLWAFGS